METNIPEPSRRSILKMMKAVAFCAVAFGCITPMLRLWQAGVIEGGTSRGLAVVVIFEAVVVPLAWVGLSWCIIRRGVWRDRLITALLLGSVVVALGFACWSFATFTIPAYGNLLVPPENRVVMSTLGLHLTAMLALAAAARFLATRLRRGYAPR